MVRAARVAALRHGTAAALIGRASGCVEPAVPPEVSRAGRRGCAGRASSARYDAGRDRVIVRLTTGVEIGFAPRDAEGLAAAWREDLAVIEVEALGLGIHFLRLDADFHVPALLDGVLGSQAWMAARLGAAGGKARGGAKAAAARANGKRGGRPRKVAGG